MKKMMLLMAFACFTITAFAKSESNLSTQILSFITTNPYAATQDDVSSLLGKPLKTEESKNQSVWYYKTDNNTLTIYWDSRVDKMEKLYFNTLTTAEKSAWDNNTAHLLKTGETALTEAIKILGAPKDMMIKANSQQLHYAYANNVLNLFFRKGTLVTYTLY
ncbi:MAG TPA: hypothetical protein VN721_17520 [Flavipsychrobacter sp.]|nr:hypothetical protein [Flavipsychrobacter sp.]